MCAAFLQIGCNARVESREDATVGEVGGMDADDVADAADSSDSAADAIPSCDTALVDVKLGDAAPSSDARTLGTGQGFTCSLEAEGTVLCWGRNHVGQLGDGTITDHDVPAPVLVTTDGKRLRDAVELAVGSVQACVRKIDGTVWCWGGNFDGELGDGTKINRPSPTRVEVTPGVPLTSVAQVTTGNGGTCARKLDGTVLCWGRNDHGSVGAGGAWPTIPATILSPRSVLVGLGCAPLSGIEEISIAELTNCARTTAGAVLCWGFNIGGNVGDDSPGELRASPTPVLMADRAPVTGVTALAPGGTCVRIRDTALCWAYEWPGDGTTMGPTVPPHVTPTQVLVSPDGPPLTGITALAGGAQHACAILVDRTVRCWGWNENGQLGDGTLISRPSPTAVITTIGGEPLTNVVEIAPGMFHTCARKSDGAVLCWGSNYWGELGDGSVVDERVTPVSVKLP